MYGGKNCIRTNFCSNTQGFPLQIPVNFSHPCICHWCYIILGIDWYCYYIRHRIKFVILFRFSCFPIYVDSCSYFCWLSLSLSDGGWFPTLTVFNVCVCVCVSIVIGWLKWVTCTPTSPFSTPGSVFESIIIGWLKWVTCKQMHLFLPLAVCVTAL
jgi:hypothetical protein